MRGVITILKVGGLRPEDKGNRNGPLALNCVNGKVYKGAIAGMLPDITMFPDIYLSGAKMDLIVDWPFPQLFQTDSGLYLGTRSGMYLLLLVAGTWTATCISAGFTGQLEWPWTLANAPLYPVFASGDCLVYFDPDADSWTTWIK